MSAEKIMNGNKRSVNEGLNEIEHAERAQWLKRPTKD